MSRDIYRGKNGRLLEAQFMEVDKYVNLVYLQDIFIFILRINPMDQCWCFSKLAGMLFGERTHNISQWKKYHLIVREFGTLVGLTTSDFFMNQISDFHLGFFLLSHLGIILDILSSPHHSVDILIFHYQTSLLGNCNLKKVRSCR